MRTNCGDYRVRLHGLCTHRSSNLDVECAASSRVWPVAVEHYQSALLFEHLRANDSVRLHAQLLRCRRETRLLISTQPPGGIFQAAPSSNSVQPRKYPPQM